MQRLTVKKNRPRNTRKTRKKNLRSSANTRKAQKNGGYEQTHMFLVVFNHSWFKLACPQICRQPGHFSVTSRLRGQNENYWARQESAHL